jgi:hypothetical protein
MHSCAGGWCRVCKRTTCGSAALRPGVCYRNNFLTNIFKTLSLFVTIPVTSCSCERAFSKLIFVKNKLRSQMSQERLECLLMIFVEQEMATNINFEDIIEEFKSLTPAIRRLEL